MIWSGLWERRWLSLIVLVVALVPVSAAALGPMYRDAAETAIVRDALSTAPVEGRGWFYASGDDPTLAAVTRFTQGAAFLDPPAKGMELVSPRAGDKRRYPLMWQDGQCEHLTMLKGRCPRAAKEVIVATTAELDVGASVKLTMLVNGPGDPGAVPLKVVGVYRATNAAEPYWFNRQLFSANEAKGEPFFTVPETRLTTYTATASPDQGGWIDFAAITVDPRRLLGSDLAGLRAVHARAVATSRELGTTLNGGIENTISTMVRQIDSLSVPLVLVIAQLSALGWLLLFQTVADLVRARGPEIALARLRGQSRWQVWRFGLTEPVAVLAVALVAGIALAGVAARLLAPPGVPVSTSPAAVLAGAVAVLGGVAAAALFAHRTAVRPVTEEWRRTPRRSARGWVLDAIVLALAGLGLVELLAAGVITETSGRHVAALAVPGLLALSVALLAARLLPLLARALFQLTRRRGGLGAFLAIRQVARGSVTAGSVIVVATAVGVATFAAVAWTVTSANFRQVAATHTGADTVIDVARVDVAEFRRAVEAADSSGKLAAPIVRMPGNPQMVAADPERLARIGYWEPGLAAQAGKLRTAAAPRLWLRGERLRVRASYGKAPKDWQVHVFALLRVPGAARGGQIPVGPGIGEWNLPAACRTTPCELRGFRGEVDFSTETSPEDVPYDYRITALEILRDGSWELLDASLTDEAAWTGDGRAGKGGLSLGMHLLSEATVRPLTYPDALPAIANGRIDGGTMLPGLDDLYGIGVEPVAVAASAPGLSRLGAVVDLDLADRVAYSVTDKATFEVWAARGRAGEVVKALRTEGLTVLGVRHAAELRERFTTQGPGSALALLLVAAVAAAALALGRAVLALYAAARRRGYELAALEAAGARGRALRVSLWLEQTLTLGAGVFGGVLAGVLGARVALPRIPQFAEQPVTPPLVYDVSPTPVLVVGGAALAAGLLAAVLLSEVLIRGITIDRLREAPT